MNNPATADDLHSYYSSEEEQVINPFHQFLVNFYKPYAMTEGILQKDSRDFTSLQPILLHGYTLSRKKISDIGKTCQYLQPTS